MQNARILDSSALLAVLNKEKGAENVTRYLSHAIISTVNLIEVVTYLMNRGMGMEEARAITESLLLEIIAFDEEMAYDAAALSRKTRSYGLSLGDRACLALAKLRGDPVLTADRVWAQLDVGLDIEVIR